MKTAIIFGSSGLIGNELFKTILLNNTYSKIKIFVRKFKMARLQYTYLVIIRGVIPTFFISKVQW